MKSVLGEIKWKWKLTASRTFLNPLGLSETSKHKSKKHIPAKNPNRGGWDSWVRFIDSIPWFDSLIRFMASLHLIRFIWFGSLLRFVASIDWFDPLISIIASLPWFSSLIQFVDSTPLISFIDSIRWFDSLNRIGDSIHRFDSLMRLRDSSNWLQTSIRSGSLIRSHWYQ